MIFNCVKVPYTSSAPSNVKEIINTQILDTLIELKNGAIVPKLLKNAYFDFASQEYVLELAPNTTFHNNRSATLDDLEFSLLREYYTYRKDRGAGRLGAILGIEKIGELGLKKYTRGVVIGIKQQQPNILRIKLTAPDPDFLLNLATWRFSLVPMEELTDNYAEWKKYPIGAGSYKVAPAGYQNGKLTLVNAKALKPTAPEKIIFSISYAPDVVYDFAISAPITNFKILKNKYLYKQLAITFLNSNDLTTNYHFRKLMQLVIDRKKLAQIAQVNTEIKLIVEQSWLTKEIDQKEKLSLIKEYLSKIPAELKQKEWVISMYSGSTIQPKEKQTLVKELIAQLKEYGFNLKYQTYTTQQLPKEIAQTAVFDLSYYRVNGFDYLYKYLRLIKNADDLYGKPEYDATLEELYTKALNAPNRDEKFKYINELDSYINTKAYWIPLLELELEYYYNPATIEKIPHTSDFLITKFEEIVLKN